MDFRILGPLEVDGELGAVALGAIKPRAVLAILLLHPNQPVSAERIALALWGEEAPADATRTVQVYVSRLRKALGDPDAIDHDAGGLPAAGAPGRARRRALRSAASRQGGARSRPARPSRRRCCCARRSSCGADRRWRSWSSSRSRRRRSRGWRSSGWPRSRRAWRPTSRAGRHAALVSELRQLAGRAPDARAVRRPADARALSQRAPGRGARGLPRRPPRARRPGRHRARSRAAASARRGARPGRIARALAARGRSAAGARRRRRPRRSSVATPIWRGCASIGRPRRTGTAASSRSAASTASGRPGSRLSWPAKCIAPAAGCVYLDGRGPPAPLVRALGELRRAGAPDARRPRRRRRPSRRGGGRARRPGAGARQAVRAGSSSAPAVADDVGAHDTLVLEPLDAAAVRDHRRRSRASRPSALLDAGEGVPRRVHELATRQARREAARRVDTAAARTAAGRAELQLAGGRADRRGDRAAGGPGPRRRGGDDATTVRCPFKGLAAFDVADAPYFFGRERLVAELVARLVGAPLLGVVGPSGSGKSSVVRAGLLPALADGVLPGSAQWDRLIMRPGEHPLRELATVTTGRNGDRRVLLVVDQFEETFTACRDEDERRAFVAALTAPDRGERAVVLAIRADHYGRCSAYPELSRLLAAHHVLVERDAPRRAPPGDRAPRAARRPAGRARADRCAGGRRRARARRAADALDRAARALAAARRTAPAADHLRSHRRRARRGRAACRGGVRAARTGAAGRRPQRAAAAGRGGRGRRDRAPPDRAVRARRRGRRGGRACSPTSACSRSAPAPWSSPTRRCCASGRACAGGWRRTPRDGACTATWPTPHATGTSAGRDAGDLYRGARLAAALEWRARHEPDLNRTERAFLDAGRGAEHAARTRRRRRVARGDGRARRDRRHLDHHRRQRGIQRARAEQRAADSRSLATRALARLRRQRLARRAAGARGLPPRADRRGPQRHPLRAARAGRLSPASAARSQHRTGLQGVAISPDGRTLASAADDGTISLWDVAARRRLGPPLSGHDRPVMDVAFSPDGTLLASGGDDATVRLWDVTLPPAARPPAPAADAEP